VYGIVKQSDGYVWVYSEPGLGTSFKIYLPAVTADITPDGAAPLVESSGTETILVVEDEPAVRNLSCRILETHGYSVLEAENGREALRLIGEASRPIHMIVCDVIMPEMNGRELARALEERGYNLPILYMSGYTGVDVIRRGLLTDQDPFIAKPFNGDALAEVVRQILDRQPGAPGHPGNRGTRFGDLDGPPTEQTP
jgi:CheY-like chemotaxis protein